MHEETFDGVTPCYPKQKPNETSSPANKQNETAQNQTQTKTTNTYLVPVCAENVRGAWVFTRTPGTWYIHTERCIPTHQNTHIYGTPKYTFNLPYTCSPQSGIYVSTSFMRLYKTRILIVRAIEASHVWCLQTLSFDETLDITAEVFIF